MSNINITKTPIDGLVIIEPKVHTDERGSFMEIYNQKDMYDLGLKASFVQDNQSISKKGVLRGLHVQKKYPQSKLIRVVQGTIYDVVVDMRKDSETYRQWYGIELSEDNNKQLYIPEGFAHGFYVMSEIAKVNYKVSDFWHPNDEIGILWNDPYINIKWPIPDGEEPIIAEKDKNYNLMLEMKG